MIILRETSYIPKHRNDLKAMLKEFEDSNSDIKEVLYGKDDYVNAYSCYHAIHKAIGYTKKRGVIKVTIEDGRIFLLKLI